jgi:hypothetical protein
MAQFADPYNSSLDEGQLREFIRTLVPGIACLEELPVRRRAGARGAPGRRPVRPGALGAAGQGRALPPGAAPARACCSQPRATRPDARPAPPHAAPPPLRSPLQEEQLGAYCQVAARKFMVFDARQGRVLLRQLLTSAVWQELQELRMAAPDDPLVGNNWFSLQVGLRVWNGGGWRGGGARWWPAWHGRQVAGSPAGGLLAAAVRRLAGVHARQGEGLRP